MFAVYIVSFLIGVQVVENLGCNKSKFTIFHILHTPFPDMHIGKRIQDELKTQGRSVTWFAKQLPCDRSNVYKIFKHESIDLVLLMRISKILNHDFFKDCSDEL